MVAPAPSLRPGQKLHPYVELLERASHEAGGGDTLEVQIDPLMHPAAYLIVPDDDPTGYTAQSGLTTSGGSYAGPARKLRAAAELLASASLRSLLPRLKMLARTLEAARAAVGQDIDPAYTRARLGKLNDALTDLMADRGRRTESEEFQRAVSNLPPDLEIYSMFTHELIETYLNALVRVQEEAQYADARMLKSLRRYIEQISAIESEQHDSSASAEREMLEQRLQAITERLDGRQLHGERLNLHREVEALYRRLEGRLSRSDRKRMEHEYAQLATRLQGLEDLRARLIAQRDFTRSRLSQLASARHETGLDEGVDLELERRHELQAAIRARHEKFQRLALVLKPLSRFNWRTALSEQTKVLPSAGYAAGGLSSGPSGGILRVARLWQRLAAIVLARTADERTLRVMLRLLEQYWSAPGRILRVVQAESRLLAEDRGQQRPFEVPLLSWLDQIRERSQDPSTTLEQFLLGLCHSAPASLKTLITECYNANDLSRRAS
ncbi:MAG: hypothetical protein KDK91_07645 [Gammaproteobacteria bacterium]|nr:hypothetical protein [Gammaproteobacteria bacterium]